MIRALLLGLVGIIVAAFVRSLVGMIFKEMGQMMKPPEQEPGEAPKAQAPNSSLKKCVVCGTYTTPDRMLGESYCSAACQEKARAA